uniref:Uncharacterized protein n=1 Tax=candidate division WOR-3 bacterium TaxID=2052148 RepID=A0A7C4CB47_UNCW3
MEREPATQTSDGRGRAFLSRRVPLSVLLVLLVCVAGAAYVVVRNATRVTMVPVTVKFGPVQRDTSIVRVRARAQRGLNHLRRRVADFRTRVPTLSPHQDSLVRECDSGLARLGVMVARLDSLTSPAEVLAAAQAAREYQAQLRELVNRFCRSVDSCAAAPDTDSLDREFERLLSR